MLGAIIGDIVGSRFEWNNIKTKEFEFLNHKCFFTDDSVMTAAVCRACTLHPEPVTKLEFNERAREYAVQLRQFYSYFPHAGYGQMFSEWASDRRNMKKQKSYGKFDEASGTAE